MDALKIALFYFIDMVLCARPFERRITKEIMHDVNDLDYFNNFSWGTYMWKILHKQMTKRLIGKVEKYKKEHSKDHIKEKYKEKYMSYLILGRTPNFSYCGDLLRKKVAINIFMN